MNNKKLINDDIEKILILTVGLPYSGKSTWANCNIFPIVNPDAIRLSLHGNRFIKESEPMVWSIANYMVNSLFLAGHTRVVLDACNVEEKYRKDWCGKPLYKTMFKVFNSNKDECISRAKNNNDDYILPIIERMAKVYYFDYDLSNNLGLLWDKF